MHNIVHQQLLAKNLRLRDSHLSLVRPRGGLRLVADKTTKKKKQEDHRS